MLCHAWRLNDLVFSVWLWAYCGRVSLDVASVGLLHEDFTRCVFNAINLGVLGVIASLILSCQLSLPRVHYRYLRNCHRRVHEWASVISLRCG